MCQQNPGDINEAFDRFHEFLVRFLYYLTGKWDAAEDLAQDVWLLIHSGKRQYDPSRGSYRTWLCWLARQRAFVHHRAERNRPRTPLGEETGGPVDKSTPDPLLAVVRRETEDRVRRALMQLPDLHREVTCLYYVEEMGCEEIARIVECPVRTVHSRLHAARLKLKDSLDGPNL